jgi:hypothetical protein
MIIKVKSLIIKQNNLKITIRITIRIRIRIRIRIKIYLLSHKNKG